ncbi:MAG: NAD(P)-dependent oxidoreductase [Candidatus Latescibacteria bacterium]|jgi:UDP-glucose 4-epimerase|nr:NAD(P)-dependent oxidoreductase [Candidatus Latescibacterota bacterium]
MTKLLITGAAGRLGANIVRQVLDKGYDVRGLVLPDDPKKTKLDGLDLEVIEGDLRDADLCQTLVDGVDAVIHTANIMGPPQGMDNRTFFDINVNGTFNLFEAAAPLSDRLDRFVHVSSDSVYPMGNQEVEPCYQPVDEAHPKRPFKLYATTKRINEAMADSYRTSCGLRTAIIRPAGMFAGQEILPRWTVSFVAGLIRSAAGRPESGLHHPEGEEIAQDILDRAEDPQQPCSVRDKEGNPWMYSPADARDVAQACICALEHPAAVGEAFNAAIPRPLPLTETAEYLASKTGVPPLEVQVPMRWIYWSDIRKAKSLIGYEPQCDLEVVFDTAFAHQAGEPVDVVPA